MKILKKHIDFKHKIFQVKMIVEDNTDDCWNIFNLLSVGDLVYGTCRRKIAKETLTGLVKNQQKTFNVLIKIMVSFSITKFVWQKFDYDADADIIRATGINVRENKYIGLGAHQSVEIKGQKQVTLIKR